MNFKKAINTPDANNSGLVIDEPAQSAAPAPAAGSSAQSIPSRPASSSPSHNKLSSDVEIKGKVRFKDDLVVDGKIEGEIESSGNLTVQQNAHIKAEIKTTSVTIEGKVHGNINVSQHARITKTAEVIGDIKANTMEIESGAVFVGRSTIGTPSSNEKPASTPKPASASPAQKTSTATTPTPSTPKPMPAPSKPTA